MKKFVLFLAIALGFTAVQAQEGGNDRLPAAGDWALGFDALPMLRYIGNLANGNTNNTVNTAFPYGDQTLYGKYFLDEQTAIRARLRVGYSSNSATWNVDDDNNTTPDPVFVEDKQTLNSFNLTIGGGYEKRRGYGNLQGFYGGELLISFANSGLKYEYGNELDPTTGGATSIVDFFTGTDDFVDNRTIEVKNGSSFGLGARGFIGVEYFILPKVSLGGEFGWGLGFVSNGKGEVTNEFINTNNEVETETLEGSLKTGSFSLDTDNLSGSIFLLFHF